MTKTLYISVSDTFKVNDSKKLVFKLVKNEVFFVEYFSDILEQIFSNINNFCRPPTVININYLIPKNHLAI